MSRGISDSQPVGVLDVHAVPVPGGDWTLWRTAVLRGAGFPARLVLQLVGEEEAAAADRYLAACDELQHRRRESTAALKERSAAATQETRHRLSALRRKIWQDVLPEDIADPAIDAVRTALEAKRAAHRDLVRACDADAVLVGERIRMLASDRRFREALVWQNREGAARARRRMEERRGPPSEQWRAIEYFARHVQRYAVKNDSIGFFGPIGWMTLTDDDRTVEVRPEPELVDHLSVFFEGWCIDALAAHLDKDPAIRPWTAPRLRPDIWCGPDGVHVPADGRLTLEPIEEQVLRLCDGVRTATDIAGVLLNGAAASGQSEQEIFGVLDRLVARQLVAWRLDVAPQLRPERELAWRLSRIGEPAARDASLQALNAVVAARDAVAAAAGDPEQLEIRLGDLDATFTRITAAPATRRPGQTYAARGLVYMDCHRACDVALGRAFLDRIGPALSAVLDGVRWFLGDIAAGARQRLRLRHAELREQVGAEALDAKAFIKHVRAVGRRAPQAFPEELARRYQERWQSVFQLPDGDPRHIVTYDVAEFSTRVRRAFGEPDPAWARAGYLSPDLMIAAESAEALRRGAFHAVLGEVHGKNTLLTSAVISQHPNPELVAAALAFDTAQERYVLVQSLKDQWLARGNMLVLPTFWRYQGEWDRPSLPECRALPAALLQAFDTGETVVMRARDGSVEFDALELFDDTLTRIHHGRIGRMLPYAHTPRLVVGDLTVAREMWLKTVEELPFLCERDEYVQFAAVRQWARDCGMPRHVFYGAPGESKPCFLDFDSRMYVRIFVKMMRGAPKGEQVRVVEMLPGVHDTWLHDAAGERYTCELRLAARRASARPPSRIAAAFAIAGDCRRT